MVKKHIGLVCTKNDQYESYGFEKDSSGVTQSLEVMRNVPMINSEMIYLHYSFVSQIVDRATLILEGFRIMITANCKWQK